jgi:phosphoribosylanthranilate isomerase
MRTRIKICGISRNEDARAAVAAGADAIGLVFYPASKRAVSVDAARDIVAGLPAFVTITALFVDAEREAVEQVCGQLPVNLLQFHGNESAEYCESFALPYMKALRVADGEGLIEQIRLYSSAQAILLDTWQPDSPGGTGKSFDWSVIPEEARASIVLAGGLNFENVTTAIDMLQPYAVDVSGGVEISPGVKSGEKMQKFVQAVRDADLQNHC